MATTNEVLGTVQPDGSLHLDQKLTISPGRVKVRVEPVGPLPLPTEGLIEFVQRTRRELETGGHRFMTGEEATAWIDELRSDDARTDEAYRRAEDANRHQGPKE